MDLSVHNTVLLHMWWNTLIKFSKQIANTFAKIISGYKGEFKTLSNICNRAFSAGRYLLQRRTKNRAKHLRWSFLQKKKSKTKSRSLFLEKLPSLMFDKVLNMLRIGFQR